MDVAAQKAQRQHGQQCTVGQAHPHFLPEQLEFFGSGQVLVHQHTDGHSQRLGAHIAGHIQHHGLEADDDGQHRHHRFKRTHHRGHQHPEEQQGNQPGQALFHTLEHTLVQVLLAGQAAEFCVIIAHLVVHQLDHIRRGDDAQQLPAVVQDRERALGVVHDAVDAVADLLVVGDVGIGAGDQLFQALLRTGHDEVFQVDGTIKVLVLIHHIQGGDVIVLACLLHQLTHGLPDGHIPADADVVGGHAAADLVLVIGEQQLHIIGGILVQLVDDLCLIVLFQVIQSIHSIVRIHVGDDPGGPLGVQLLQVRLCVVQIGEDLCHRIHAQCGVHLLALLRCQGRQGIGQVIFMVIGQLFSQLCLGQTAVDDVQNLLHIIFLLHGLVPPFPVFGHKKYTASVWLQLLRCTKGMQFRMRLTRLHGPHRRRSVVWGDPYGHWTWKHPPPWYKIFLSASLSYYAGPDFSTPFTVFLPDYCSIAQRRAYFLYFPYHATDTRQDTAYRVSTTSRSTAASQRGTGSGPLPVPFCCSSSITAPPPRAAPIPANISM